MEDVLFEVFEYLSLSDRKNARLVCRSWRGVCGRAKFTNTEAFFVPREYQLSTVLRVLQMIQNRTMNVKFDSRQFDERWNVLWETCGSKIRSLQFRSGCVFAPEVVPKMFQFCKNLLEVSVHGFGDLKGSRQLYSDFTPEMLDDSIVAGNLLTLRLNSLIGKRDLLCIASSFPNLENLDICLETDKECTNLYSLLELLPTRLHHIKTLHLKLFRYHCRPSGEDQRYNYSSMFFNVDFERMREFDLSQLDSMSISLLAHSLRGENLNDFLCCEKIWTKIAIIEGKYVNFLVDCEFYYTRADIVDIFNTPPYSIDSADLARILDENPQLEELHFTLTVVNVSQMIVILRSLVKSNIKILKIFNYVCSFKLKNVLREVEMLTTPLTQNNSLHSLEIHDQRSSTLCSVLVRYFRNIQRLCLRIPRVNIQDIFKLQSNLISLKINESQLDGSTRDESTAGGVVETLEFIEILAPTGSSIFNYTFPNLKYFSYKNNQNPGRVLSHLKWNSPNLVGIYIHNWVAVDIEVLRIFFRSCLNFQQLRYVWMDCQSLNVEKAALMREMAECSSHSSTLRSVCVKFDHKWEIRYFFNTISREFEFFDSNNPIGAEYAEIAFEFWCNKR